MLRRWGEGLTLDVREEVRAAGRAILLLSDEIERLHIDLWHALDRARASLDDVLPDRDDESPRADVGATLRDRLSLFRMSQRK